MFGLHGPSEAFARGKRAVPDLRRDADRWSQPEALRSVRIPVTLHVATEGGDLVASAGRIQAWLLRANEELAPFGIQVDVRAVRRLPPGWDAVTRWKERRQLARFAPRDGSIHVFVIDELDTERRRVFRRRIRGLHWRYRGLNRELRHREYVVVTRGAPTTTFAHELGHLFGLRHSTRPDNIMCSCREGTDVRFTGPQGNEMRSGAQRFVQRQWVQGFRAADRRRRR